MSMVHGKTHQSHPQLKPQPSLILSDPPRGRPAISHGANDQRGLLCGHFASHDVADEICGFGLALPGLLTAAADRMLFGHVIQKGSLPALHGTNFETHALGDNHQGCKHVFELSGHETDQFASLQCAEAPPTRLCLASRWLDPRKPAQCRRNMGGAAHFHRHRGHWAGGFGFRFWGLRPRVDGRRLSVLISGSSEKCPRSGAFVVHGFGLLHSLLQLGLVCAAHNDGTE